MTFVSFSFDSATKRHNVVSTFQTKLDFNQSLTDWLLITGSAAAVGTKGRSSLHFSSAKARKGPVRPHSVNLKMKSTDFSSLRSLNSNVKIRLFSILFFSPAAIANIA